MYSERDDISAFELSKENVFSFLSEKEEKKREFSHRERYLIERMMPTPANRSAKPPKKAKSIAKWP